MHAYTPADIYPPLHTRLQALFMDHEGFLGALGAYLLHEEPEG